MDKEFKQQLCDRFTAAELADFLQISVEDFCDMFDEEIEMNYDDLAEFIGLRPGTGEDNYDQRNQYD